MRWRIGKALFQYEHHLSPVQQLIYAPVRAVPGIAEMHQQPPSKCGRCDPFGLHAIAHVLGKEVGGQGPHDGMVRSHKPL